MTTLAHKTSLRTLSRILHAASVVGSEAWDQRDDSHLRKAATESSLEVDLLALFKLLAERNVPYLLVGGVALLRYIDGRNTDDIDIILAVDEAARVPEIVIESRNPDAAKARFGSVRVDLLFTSNAVFRLAMERFATTHRFADIAVPCASVEGLVLLKLYALPSLYKQGDLQRAALYETDVLMLRQRHKPDVEPLLAELRSHLAAGEMHELTRIVGDIDHRIARMQSRQP